jgi:hypothetical protein
MAASVELQSPARETRDGIGLLNAINDNLVGAPSETSQDKTPRNSLN